MSQYEKTLERLKLLPKDFTYDEAKYILEKMGFVENNKGKTSGSRVAFCRSSDNAVIMLHRPHPQKEMKHYAVKDLLQALEGFGEI